MFVWHHLVASQIYSWPLVTGTDSPPCWPLKEPIPNDFGKRQPLAVTRGRWWLVATDLYRHLHRQEVSIILFKSIIDVNLYRQFKQTPCVSNSGGKPWSWVFLLLATLCPTQCVGDSGGRTWSWEWSYYRRHWIFTNIWPGDFMIHN